MRFLVPTAFWGGFYILDILGWPVGFASLNCAHRLVQCNQSVSEK